jgi:hypothetical protein
MTVGVHDEPTRLVAIAQRRSWEEEVQQESRLPRAQISVNEPNVIASKGDS